MDLLTAIRQVFSNRVRPTRVVAHEHPDTTEYRDALIFSDLDWEETTCQMWEKYSDSIYGFTPEAFCYFIPGIIKSSIVEKKPDMLVVDSLLGMLDRMPEPDYWDDFFIARWPRFSRGECQAIEGWLYWLSDDCGISDETVIRASETLKLLRNRQP
jgi:hypothetical protein